LLGFFSKWNCSRRFSFQSRIHNNSFLVMILLQHVQDVAKTQQTVLFHTCPRDRSMSLRGWRYATACSARRSVTQRKKRQWQPVNTAAPTIGASASNEWVAAVILVAGQAPAAA
jgi:hypothetical protein